MFALREIVKCISLVFLSTQPVFCEVFRFNDGEIRYEYDNSSTPLGRGGFGAVYEGVRTDGNHTKRVVFKEIRGTHEKLLRESHISAILGQHDSFPTFYRYFPETNETKAVFVMERIGRTLFNLWREFRPFSPITVMQIGLQILDAVEWMHSNGITHNDLHCDNIAVGYHNKSKIYLLDFSLASRKKYRETPDLSRVSSDLNEMMQSNLDDEPYEVNDALKEFARIAKEYCNISDDMLRKETFAKLRNILMRELESHKNDADYEKYVDIAYIEDASDGMNLLRKLIKQNDTTAIENLLRSGKGLNVNDGFGNSSYYKPIHLAAELGNMRMVRLLLEYGAEVNTKYNETHYAWSPLHYAAITGSDKVTRLLCESGAEINAKLLSGRTPLHWAATQNNVEAVRIICELGADTDARDVYGDTPLCYAADHNNADVVRTLAQFGAEVDVKSTDEKTPLQIAVLHGHMDVAKVLMEYGANITFKYDDGNTPLHEAVKFGYIDVVQMLIERGAEINASGAYGRTALHCTGHANIAKFLIEHGADINAKDTFGRTPLNYAMKIGNENLINILREAAEKSTE